MVLKQSFTLRNRCLCFSSMTSLMVLKPNEKNIFSKASFSSMTSLMVLKLLFRTASVV